MEPLKPIEEKREYRVIMNNLYVVYQGSYAQDVDGSTFLPKIIGVFKDYETASKCVCVFNDANHGRSYYIEQIATDII